MINPLQAESYDFEEAVWSADMSGDEISHKHFEDIRKRIFLLENLNAGLISVNKADFSDWPTSQSSANWRRVGEFRGWWGGQYWTNHEELTNNQGRTIRPPNVLHEHIQKLWELQNTFFSLAPEPDIQYHHYDANAARFHCASNRRTDGGNFRGYDIVREIGALLPIQTDGDEIERPVRFDQTGAERLQSKNKREIKDEYITQHLTLGPLYSAFNYELAGTPGARFLNHLHHNSSELATGNQYVYFEGEPGNAPGGNAFPPFFGDTKEPIDLEYHWDEKMNYAYQNWVEKIASGGNWNYPTWAWVDGQTDNEQQIAYQANWLARRDPTDATSGGVWDPTIHKAQPWYAPIRSEDWGANESGFEFVLWLMGEYDWYFDTQRPFTSQDNVENYLEYLADDPGSPTIAQALARYPRPIGTWRRTWRRSFLRRDVPNNRYQFMRAGPAADVPGSGFTPEGINWPNSGLRPAGETWMGLFVDTMPGFDNIPAAELAELAERHDPVLFDGGAPKYEIAAAMVIEMREVLGRLRTNSVDINSLNPTIVKLTRLFNGVTSYAAGWTSFESEVGEIGAWSRLPLINGDTDVYNNFFQDEEVLVKKSGWFFGSSYRPMRALVDGANVTNLPAVSGTDNAFWTFLSAAVSGDYLLVDTVVGNSVETGVDGKDPPTSNIAWISFAVRYEGVPEAIDQVTGKFESEEKDTPANGDEWAEFSVDGGATVRGYDQFVTGSLTKYHMFSADVPPAESFPLLSNPDIEPVVAIFVRPTDAGRINGGTLFGNGQAEITVDTTVMDIAARINLNFVPDSVWADDFTNHIDADHDPQLVT